MSHEVFSLEELALYLGRDRREIEKLVNRGRIPGRKVGNQWQFHQVEITRWLEQEMRDYSTHELRSLERTNRSEDFCSMLPVSALLSVETIQVPLEARNKRSILEALVEVAGRSRQIWSPSEILKAVQQREEIFATAYAGGVAIPHPRNPLPDAQGESVIAFGRTSSGIPFGAPHGGLSDLFFLVLCRDSKSHLQILARLGRILQLRGFLNALREVDDAQTAYEFLKNADEEVAGQDR
jgi:PTS system nitrogen regulatory IIA component